MCEQIVEKLNSNPVFAMSLHSKELFHSNFWAWLFGHNVEYAKIFFHHKSKILSYHTCFLCTQQQKHFLRFHCFLCQSCILSVSL